jgi:TetR/AcrR family transcriptional regulator, fatty acid metabolism regulator protein
VPKNGGKRPAPGAREVDRRRTILRAAIEVFAKKGYHGCRIADVAREAGVAYGLVYHYFHNKDELLRSVFDLSWGGFLARVKVVAEGEAPLAEKVRGVARVAFEAYRHDPRGVKVVILEIARSPAGARVDRGSAFAEVVQVAERMFRVAQEHGELRAELDPRVCASLMFGAIEMGLTALVVGLFGHRDDALVERVERQIAETLLGGVLSPHGASVEASTPLANLRMHGPDAGGFAFLEKEPCP